MTCLFGRDRRITDAAHAAPRSSRRRIGEPGAAGAWWLPGAAVRRVRTLSDPRERTYRAPHPVDRGLGDPPARQLLPGDGRRRRAVATGDAAARRDAGAAARRAARLRQ